MKKPIPKNIEEKIRRYTLLQKKAGKYEEEIRKWLYKNDYDRALVDSLLDTGLSGDYQSLVDFFNGKPDENGYTIEDFLSDNSGLDFEDYY